MPRHRSIAILSAVAALAFAVAGSASADPTIVTSGTTQVTLTGAVTSALSANHLTVTPLAPATASGSTFTFPISGGKFNTTTMHGKLRHAGGLVLTNGSATLRLRQLTLVAGKNGAALLAAAHGHGCRVVVHPHARLRICETLTGSDLRRVATLSDVSFSGDTATATAALTPFSAKQIDRLAGAQIASAGTVLGTVTVALQIG